MLAGKGKNRAGEGIIRAGYWSKGSFERSLIKDLRFKNKFNSTPSLN